MLTSILNSAHRLRYWLIAVAATVALVSVLEAGHAHGLAGQTDEQCALCNHAPLLDKVLNNSPALFIPLLLAALISITLNSFIPHDQGRFTPIRAPPKLTRTR